MILLGRLINMNKLVENQLGTFLRSFLFQAFFLALPSPFSQGFFYVLFPPLARSFIRLFDVL
jgi:hypothetical protein